MAPRRNTKPSAAQLADMRRAAGIEESKRLGIDSDDAAGLVDLIEKSSSRPRNTANRNRSSIPRNDPNYDDPTPLSDATKSHLAELGIHGLSTHGEALKHLHQTANAFGFTPGATKRTSTGSLGQLASHVASVTGTSDPLMAGREADIIDQASVLHEGITSMLQPFKYPQRNEKSDGPIDIRTGRNARTRPEIETQSLTDIPEDRPKAVPTSARPTSSVSRKPKAHGKMLRDLPAVPQPMLEGATPKQASARKGQHTKNLNQRKEEMERLSAESTESFSRIRSLRTGAENAVMAGMLWSYDPDDGGWAHRPPPAPVGPSKEPVQTPASKSKASKNNKPKASKNNPPIPLADMVGSILQGEKDILEARSKFPEQDNPMPGYR